MPSINAKFNPEGTIGFLEPFSELKCFIALLGDIVVLACIVGDAALELLQSMMKRLGGG